MKKRRKKKSLYVSLNPNLLFSTSLGSAPDVPKYDAISNEVLEIQDFLENLFGEDCDADGIQPMIFLSKLTDKTTVKWLALNDGDTLYVKIPNALPFEGSKESFISLLEYAEEKLNLPHVIACIEASSTERSSRIRTFLYMGFETMPPNENACLNKKKCFILLSYEI